MKFRKALFKSVYDRAERSQRKAMAPLRERMVRDLSGHVLEIGCGQGASFPHYPTSVQVIATDHSELMLRDARDAAKDAQDRILVEYADVQRLPYDDASFNAVVSMLVLCSVTDQARALAEVRRVLKPGGEFRLFEHVRSKRWWAYRLQQAARPAFWLLDGERLDHDTGEAVRRAGFTVEVEEELPLKDLGPLRHILMFARK